MTYKRVGSKRLAFCLSYFMLTAVSADVVTEDDLLADMHLVSSVTHMNQTLDKTPAAVTIIDRQNHSRPRPLWMCWIYFG